MRSFFNTMVARQFRQPYSIFGTIVARLMEAVNPQTYKWILSNMDVSQAKSIIEIDYGTGRVLDAIAPAHCRRSVYRHRFFGNHVETGPENKPGLYPCRKGGIILWRHAFVFAVRAIRYRYWSAEGRRNGSACNLSHTRDGGLGRLQPCKMDGGAFKTLPLRRIGERSDCFRFCLLPD